MHEFQVELGYQQKMILTTMACMLEQKKRNCEEEKMI